MEGDRQNLLSYISPKLTDDRDNNMKSDSNYMILCFKKIITLACYTDFAAIAQCAHPSTCALPSSVIHL